MGFLRKWLFGKRLSGNELNMLEAYAIQHGLELSVPVSQPICDGKNYDEEKPYLDWLFSQYSEGESIGQSLGAALFS